jgi:hypothetical protein
MKAVRWFALGIAVLLSTGGSVAFSATISWSKGDFDNDADVRNDGTTVFAYYFNGATANASASGTSPLSGAMSVNGVDWQSVNISTDAMNQFPPSHMTVTPAITTATYGHTVATSGFGALIAGVAFKTGPLTFTLSDLIPNNKYLFQYLCHHQGAQGRVETLDDLLGNTIQVTNQGISITQQPLQPNGTLTSGSWTDGEFVTGEFIADAATQSFKVSISSGSVLFSGLQLRDVTEIPEPSTLALLLMISCLVLNLRCGSTNATRGVGFKLLK